YDSFASQDFSKDDDFPSPDTEDKDFDPPFFEPLVFKAVPNSMRLLLFSSKNEEKVFKPGIYTFEKVKENQKKGQNGIKTGQKQDAWRRWEMSKAVTVNKARKTKESTKRRVRNANSYKIY
nr:hypothetical protein [Tanacetum cinerariifolium]